MDLSADELLHGAVYALDDAGQLLHDSFLLYQNRRHSSSSALAVLCKEEMGRFEMLLGSFQRAKESGRPISRDSILQQCDNHVEKLRRSELSLIDLDEMGSPDLALDIFRGPWGSERQKEGWKRAKDLFERRARRIPHKLHQKRLHAFYVEPAESGKGWIRPKQLSGEECHRLLKRISFEYEIRYDWYEKNAKDHTTVVAQWKAHPVLPKPLRLD